MERLASQWKLILLATAVAGVGVVVGKPDYNTLQMSNDTNDFRRLLGDQHGRALFATVCDMLFTAGYGVLGVIAFRKLATGSVALIGTILVVGGALADEIENVLLFVNINHANTLTNGRIDDMTAAGAIKWSLAAVAIILLIVVAGRARATRKGSATRA